MDPKIDEQDVDRAEIINQSPAAACRADFDRIIGSVEKVLMYAEKSLHETCRLLDLVNERTLRPYYPLNGTWGLTKLSTGQPFFINTEDRNISPWIIMGGHWEVNVDNVMSEYVREGMNVIDIGANMGYYTVKLGSKVGRIGKLFAFEPNPEVNCVCLENIKINGLMGWVTLNCYALGDVASKATLTRSHSNMASANLIGDQDADFNFEVEVRRLDDVLTDSISIDFIKLDAEGYERQILDGAQHVIDRSPGVAIMIELGLERWEARSALHDLPALCGANKTIYAVTDDGGLMEMSIDSVRDFLMTCNYHENYFFLAPKNLAQQYVGNLIKV